MEMVIIFLVIIVVFTGVYFIIQIFNKKDGNKNNSHNVVRKEKNVIKNDDNPKILKEETIVVNNDGLNEEIVLKIIEDDGDIKLIDCNIATVNGTSIYSIKGKIDAFWGDSDDGPITGNNIIICNNHLIIIKYRDNMNGEDDYYIDINNIEKITRKNSYRDFPYDGDKLTVPVAIFTIYTKNNNSLELIYPNDILIPDENCPVIIKKENNNILFEYTYDMNNRGDDIEYKFADNEVKIGKNRYYNPTKPNSRDYEIVINYNDIVNKDMINKDGKLNTTIDTRNNYKYIFVFTDSEKLTKFYSELESKIK